MFGVPASNLYGTVVVQRLLERDRRDHVAAALVRRHRLEQRAPAVEHADAGRAEHLVAREHVEVAVERLHVDHEVRHRLRAVDEHDRAARVRLLRSSRATGLIVPSAFETWLERDDLRARRQQPRERVEIDLAALVDRHDPQPRAGLLAQHLPRHDVGVVLEPGDEDLVARRSASAARSSARRG